MPCTKWYTCLEGEFNDVIDCWACAKGHRCSPENKTLRLHANLNHNNDIHII